MRKMFSLILCLCMLLLAGCESNAKSADNKTSMFRGLAPDEMIITSYLAPWPE